MDDLIMNMEECLQPKYFSEDDLPRTNGTRPEYCHTMTICVDSFSEKLAVGRIHNYFFEEEVHFQSLDQMLFALEDILNRAYGPMRDAHLRTSFDMKRELEAGFEAYQKDELKPYAEPFYNTKNISVKPGALQSFYVRIVARQHCSMQGILSKSRSKDSIAFRSEMELITLLREELIREEARKSNSK